MKSGDMRLRETKSHRDKLLLALTFLSRPTLLQVQLTQIYSSNLKVASDTTGKKRPITGMGNMDTSKVPPPFNFVAEADHPDH